MAVPSSGELKLYADIQNEAEGAQADTSLHNLSIYAGFSTPDAMSDFYGWADIELGAVTTNSTSNITSNSMRLNGNLTSTGNDTSVQVGFHHGTSTNRASNPTYSAGTKSTTGTFLVNRSGLSYGTNYYAWAYATTDAGTVYGSRADATTTYPPFTPSHDRHNEVETNCIETPSGLCYVETGYYNPYSGVATNVARFCGQCKRTFGNLANSTTTNAKSYACVYICNNEPSAPWPIMYGDWCAESTPSYYYCNCSVTFFGDVPSGASEVLGIGNQSLTVEAFSVFQGKVMGSKFDFCYKPSDIRLKTNINYL